MPDSLADCRAAGLRRITGRERLMSGLGLAFLILTALALYNFDRRPEDTGRGLLARDGQYPRGAGSGPWELLRWVFLALWLPLFVDALTSFRRQGDFGWASARRLLLLTLIPPFRIALSPYPARPCIWLPWLGWQVADHDLFERLERFFSVPMLFFAVLILPVLAGEFIWTGGIAPSTTLRFALDLGTALIWVAFCVEFIVMSTVAPSKLGYIARNGINLAVILLPFLAFLRGVMALRLVWFAKLGTTLKVYRMRGLGMRAWRGLVALDLLERLSHRTPLARLTHLRGILREKEREVARLRRRIHHLEAEQGIADPAQDPAPQDPPPGPPPHAQSCRNPAASPP